MTLPPMRIPQRNHGCATCIRSHRWPCVCAATTRCEPRLHRTYAVDPAPARDEQMIFVGPFLVERFTVRPSGVRLGVFGGLGIIYTEDVDAETSGYRPHWHIATWDDRYAW
jgi:hypothetical protein